MEERLNILNFTQSDSIVKVIGVGGGGGHAVNKLYLENPGNISFLVCNTDTQDLKNSPVPFQLALGKETTHGNGCGADPEKGRTAAEESHDEIRDLLDDGTRMVFITAGMGGGTGTGASPVIAKIAKDELHILTIGIVTLPFLFEYGKRYSRALEGIKALKQSVDSLVIISNELLFETNPEMTLENAFSSVDAVVSNAARSIAEIVTIPGNINIDFADVNTIMNNSGVAIMNIGYSKGQSSSRLQEALNDALNTPLLQNRKIQGANRVLLNIYTSSKRALSMPEIDYINEFLQGLDIDENCDVIWGCSTIDDLEESLKVTLIITGFEVEEIPEFREEYARLTKNRRQGKPAQPAEAAGKIQTIAGDEMEEGVDQIDFDFNADNLDTAPSKR